MRFSLEQERYIISPGEGWSARQCVGSRVGIKWGKKLENLQKRMSDSNPYYLER
ncbi:MAG: hypothetical protein HY313_02680 [Acidobacteria bacterium]|nr:hypothetical protein [Acidobacteriota bacterium]